MIPKFLRVVKHLYFASFFLYYGVSSFASDVFNMSIMNPHGNSKRDYLYYLRSFGNLRKRVLIKMIPHLKSLKLMRSNRFMKLTSFIVNTLSGLTSM